MISDYSSLPKDLIAPEDDGAAKHLINLKLPNISLKVTNGKEINLLKHSDKIIIYCYPMTGVPGNPLPQGWDQIPGARGCTPQNCSFRNNYQQLKKYGFTQVYGLSTQNSEYQSEMAMRLHLPFSILSDQDLQFTKSLSLPTFKRLTMIIQNSTIKAVHYPVFPSDSDIDWIKNQVNHQNKLL